MLPGLLYVKVDADYVRVAPCQVDPRDGGTFAVDESEAKSGRKTVTWRRIGTIPGWEALR